MWPNSFGLLHLSSNDCRWIASAIPSPESAHFNYPHVRHLWRKETIKWVPLPSGFRGISSAPEAEKTIFSENIRRNCCHHLKVGRFEMFDDGWQLMKFLDHQCNDRDDLSWMSIFKCQVAPWNALCTMDNFGLCKMLAVEILRTRTAKHSVTRPSLVLNHPALCASNGCCSWANYT